MREAPSRRSCPSQEAKGNRRQPPSGRPKTLHAMVVARRDPLRTQASVKRTPRARDARDASLLGRREAIVQRTPRARDARDTTRACVAGLGVTGSGP